MALTEKLAAIAEANYIPFAPHNPSGPIANAATLQIAACCPNFSILEIMYSDVEWRKDVTDETLEYADGYLKIPDKPGLGIEIHEEPRLSPKSSQILGIGDVVTVEPGIYIPSEFGVRIEDMAYITENGCENLTKSPKNLIIL